MGDVLSGEFYTLGKVRASHLTSQTQMGESQTLITSRKREQRFIAESSLFSVGEVFAIAKVKLLCSEVCATHK